MRNGAVFALLAVVLAAMLMGPASARYLPTKRGSYDERTLERLRLLVKEMADALEPEQQPNFEQRVFYKREAPLTPEQAAQLQRPAELNPAPLM